jgi:hypothetical protein
MRSGLRYFIGLLVVVGIAAGAFYLGRTMPPEPPKYVVDTRCFVLQSYSQSPGGNRVVLYWSDGSVTFAPAEVNANADFYLIYRCAEATARPVSPLP